MTKIKSFKNFFLESLVPSTELNQEKNKVISSKWDVILFYGSYNPITKKEITDIKNFIKRFNIKNDTQIGLIVNDVTDNNSNYLIQKQINYELNFNEKRYISTKFFGLKMFGFDLEKIIDLLNLKKIYSKKAENNNDFNITKNKHKHYVNLNSNDNVDNNNILKDINNELKEYVDKLIFLFKNNFYSNNILIVMPKENIIDLDDLIDITEFTGDKINLGFTFWSYQNTIKDDESYKIFGNFLPMTGDMIKAVVLLNYEKPNPENLKNFCHKYKLNHLFNEIKNIHFKLNNDNYYLAFEYLFPEVNIQSFDLKVDAETKKTNLLFIMEMLKEMYLKNV